MNGIIDWPNDSSEEWPEGWGDIAKGVLMPHTGALSLAEKVLDRGRAGRGGKVVQHTQPPPVAQSAREVQGQLTGLLRTVKNVEEKLDDNTRQLALLQRASSGNQDVERFQNMLTTSVLAAAPLVEQRNWLGAATHLAPILQSARGATAALSIKPISTFGFPLAALGVYALREPRPPVIIISSTKKADLPLRVTMISPDGGEIRYALDLEVTRGSTKYEKPFIVNASTKWLRARTYLVLRGSDPTEIEFT